MTQKTPQKILDQAREELEELFKNWRPPKLKEILSWHTSTLRAFIEAEISRLEDALKLKPHTEWQNGYSKALQDQITHLKELLVVLLQ